MIVISRPFITSENGKSRLNAEVSIDSEKKTVWFEVDSKFEQYLCYERGDAFVVAILNYAMRNRHDIVSEAPIQETLYYQLDKDLIEALHNNSKKMHKTKISAPIDSSVLECAGAVGTGISCGVDSMYSIAEETNQKFTKHNITHLAFNNVGSHGEGERAIKLFNERQVLAEKFCEEYGFTFVKGDSNLHDVIKQEHLLTHTFSSMFSVFALQKLYSIYYYASSGHPYSSFSLKNNEKYDSGLYELLSLNCFSTHSLKIYSEGGEKTRLDKVKSIVNYVPSYNYLNVCLCQFENCGLCEKCVRTLVAIDALGKLENYRPVFNIDYYNSHKTYYYRKLIKGTIKKNDMYAGVYPLLKKRISVYVNVLGVLDFIAEKAKIFLKRLLPQPIKIILKRMLGRK